MHTRILVALEDEYRAYREVLAAGVQALRPDARVETTVSSDVGEKKADFDPQVVICDAADPTGACDTIAWIVLSVDPSRPSKVCLGRRRFEQRNPTLMDLLNIVDEATRLAKDKNHESAQTPDESGPT